MGYSGLDSFSICVDLSGLLVLYYTEKCGKLGCCFLLLVTIFHPVKKGMADQFVGASSGMAQSKSSPAIHQSLISLKSVQEDSMLTDPENDLVEEPEEEDTAFLCAQVC